MKKTWNVVLAMWRPMLLALAALALAIGLVGFRLSSLTPGLSAPEIAVYESADSIKDIVDNSVNAPYKTLVYLTTKALRNELGLRLVNAALGVAAIVLFYLFARKLLRPLVAVGTTALFATSGLFLSTARSATPDVMLFSLLALMVAGYILRFSNRSAAAWIAASAILTLSLYVPGMILFIIPGALWQFKRVRSSFEELKPASIILCAAIVGILAAPLVVSLIRSPELWRSYLGLPMEMASATEMAKDAGSGLASLFVVAPHNSARWLGRQPALDVFATTMFIYGVIALGRKRKLDRLWVLGGVFLLAVVWVGVSMNTSAVVLLLPFVYIVVGMGLDRFMQQWLEVFPRNPIARYAGGLLMVAATLLAINFQLQRYFVAWPNNNATRQVFDKRLPD